MKRDGGLTSNVWRGVVWLARSLPLALFMVVPNAHTQPASGPPPVPIGPPHGFPPAWHGMPGPMTPPKLPPLAHEQAPVDWPVVDYFDQALQMTGLKPGTRASSLKLRMTANEEPPYLALPVQSQAFGFSPAFRALVGAELDQQLEAAGIDAAGQTDLVDGQGPFVRRFDVARVDAFAAEHPKHKLIGLYVGHDGVTQMFLTLVVRDGAKRQVAHRALALPADPASAFAPISAALPSLLKEAGLPVRPTDVRADRPATGCQLDTFNFATPTRNAPSGARACHAFALGMLLPVYETVGARFGAPEAQSPARLAWLAQAYVLATPEALSPATAAAIRDWTFRHLGLPVAQATTSSPAPVDDPVVQRIMQLNQLHTNSERSPARSAQDARTQQVERMTRNLPEFATAVFRAHLDFTEPFSQVDLCSIERLLPQAMPRAECREQGQAAPSRAAWPAETLLYQEWRLATYYKELDHAGNTQGSRARVDAALARWPGDAAEHPLLQRLRHMVTGKFATNGTVDDLMNASRASARAVTQNTVDLQRADRWLAGHSLNGHSWTNNLNMMNDPQVQEVTGHELRLLSVLRFDRFTMDRYLAPRKAGDTAFFLAPPMLLNFSSGGMPPYLVQSGPPMQAGMPPPSFLASASKRKKFPTPFAVLQVSSDKELLAEIENSPTDLHARTTLAIGRLQDGGTLADALKLIDAQPRDQRLDQRVSQSHAWAEPGHYFYFAGELEPARRYYAKTAEIGTGSESDMMARTRLKLLDGQLRDALESSARRADRYDSNYARRDQVGLLFMLGERDKAWQVFMSRAMSSNLFPFWMAAYTGHRMEKADLAQVDEWLTKSQLDKAQVNFTDASSLYMHLVSVMDRLPSEADVQRLKRTRGSKPYMDPMWSASAGLARSALLGSESTAAYEAASAALKNRSDSSVSFMQPLYTWVAWQASGGKDPYLDEVREVTTRLSFDEMLSKSMVLALEGKSEESLRYFTAARYQIASTSERIVPGAYSWALAGLLMHRKTGQEVYRRDTLRFVRAYQKVFPYQGWLYGMEALLATENSGRLIAACRAQHLDAGSYFLSQAQVKGVDAASCRAALKSLLH